MVTWTWTSMLLLAAADPAARADLDRVKALCRGYVEGFVSPATELAYGRRLNGPRGLATLEPPSEVAAGRVGGQDRPMGYGAGIEDTAYHNGLFLFALCDAAEATGEAYFAELAHLVFRGLQRLGTISPYPGFVPRGPHPADGKTYYRDSSLDQHTLYVCGLWRFYRSPISTAAEREAIQGLVRNVVTRLERAGWAIQVEDGSAPSWEGGSMLATDGKWPLVLLSLLAAGADVTGEPRWQRFYEQCSAEQNGRRWTSLTPRIDRTRQRRYTMFHNQHLIRGETIRRIDPDPHHRAILVARATDTAEDMLSCAYLQAWRPLEWLGTNDLTDPTARAKATAYVQRLGLTLDSPATIWDLWAKHDDDFSPTAPQHGNHSDFDTLTLTTPAMAWQCALIAARPDLVARVQPAIAAMLQRVDFAKVNHGWTYNYAVLAALWSLAAAPPTAY